VLTAAERKSDADSNEWLVAAGPVPFELDDFSVLPLLAAPCADRP